MIHNDTRIISSTPTVSTSPAYSSGDLVGGKLSFVGALNPKQGTGLLVSVNVSDKTNQSIAYELVIFSSNPSGTTFTDNAAFAIATADITKVCAVIALATGNTFAYTTSVHYLGSLACPVFSPTATSGSLLYGALVARGAPTFTGTSDITVSIGVSAD